MKKVWILMRRVNVCEGHGDYRDYLTPEKLIAFESSEAAIKFAKEHDIDTGFNGCVPIDFTILP